MRARDGLVELLDPVVQGMGYELVGVEFDGHQRVLRVYIDKPEGITVDDCSAVSYQLSGVMDVEDPIPGRYQLEISAGRPSALQGQNSGCRRSGCSLAGRGFGPSHSVPNDREGAIVA